VEQWSNQVGAKEFLGRSQSRLKSARSRNLVICNVYTIVTTFPAPLLAQPFVGQQSSNQPGQLAPPFRDLWWLGNWRLGVRRIMLTRIG
jgi:hypothetical protein